MSSSTPKLTSLTTSTLSLLLERQRLQSTHPTLHLSQIVANLRTLRSGVIDLQQFDSDLQVHDADRSVDALQAQYERLRGMLGEEEAERAGLFSIPIPPPPRSPTSPVSLERKSSLEPLYEPYTDDPSPADDLDLDEDGILLQQRHVMEAQDDHLDRLSNSIGRQHHISLQINDELEVHTGLLDGLDTELDGTDARMRSARKRLERVARGVKEHGSTVTISLLIVVLLILIVIFKT